MDKKKQIGIVAICILTCIIGVVFVSAERPTIATGDTKYVEVVRDGNVQEYEEIFVDLSGYKEVQVSFSYQFETIFVSVEMYWAIESTGEEVGVPPLSFGGFGGSGNEHVSFPISSNILKIIIAGQFIEPTDYVKIIFYATK